MAHLLQEARYTNDHGKAFKMKLQLSLVVVAGLVNLATGCVPEQASGVKATPESAADVSSAQTERFVRIMPSYEIKIVDDRWPDRPFIVEVPASNAQAVQALEFYLKQGLFEDTEDRGRADNIEGGPLSIGLVVGMVIPTEPTAEHAWSFKFDPSTVTFEDVAVEVCDASLMGIENNVQLWIDTVQGGRYCPWNTPYLVRSIRQAWSR